MGWRIVLQPNGKLARFSDIVDDFTHMDMTAEEATEVCREHMGRREAKEKVRAGLKDHKPWTVGVKGSGLDRWKDCLETIRSVHGKKRADEVKKDGAA